jgi:N utilization substance protein A
MATAQSTNASDTTLNLTQAIDVVAKEKGLDRGRLVATVEEAILKAAQSVFGATRELEAKFNEETGQIDLFQYMLVVDELDDDEREITLEDAKKYGLDAELDEELGFQLFWHPKDAREAMKQDAVYGDLLQVKQARAAFGRIAAQTAKQVLIQRVRDEERDIVFNEYKDKKGELIKGIVRRIERGNALVIDLGKTEAIMPLKEQTPREKYNAGESITALLKSLDKESKGPQVLLSRQDAALVEKLFEQVVPEIYDGIVKIVAVARQAGSRTKIAVMSRDADVDPVGACIGMKRSRLNEVMQELRGEKIDIVPYDRDPARFVCAAIQPAEVNKVIVDEAGGRMELVVSDDKQSLAIGRQGQNVRLASQLTGWKLDIISESKFRELEETSVASLQKIPGVKEPLARNFFRMGFRTIEEIADASIDEITGAAELDDATAEKLRDAAIAIVDGEVQA